ncbi:MAG: hypothetical protein IKW00_01315 [Clostridia bacterium]|nr:hypothetical protein [Clostridia bacterium]
MRQKLLPNPPENLRLCVDECYGRQNKKESDYHGCEQARPDDIHSLFLVRFTDAMAAPSACRMGVWYRPQRQSDGLPSGFAKQTKKSMKIGEKACFRIRNSGSFS